MSIVRTAPRLAAFLDVRGSRALVVGAGAVGAHKAEALLRSGAEVTVVAPELCPSMARLAQSGALRLEQRGFAEDDLEAVDLAFAATGDRELNDRIAQLARQRRIPVNVADDESTSTFTLAAVVDRPPVRIAVSTGGASPALARRVAAWIDRAVPPRTGELALLALEFRAAVRARIVDAAARRRFWEGVMNGAVAEHVLEGREAQARSLLEVALEEAHRQASASSDPGRR